MTEFIPISDVSDPFRIMTFDGGGIYGLFTALMLRKLCEKNSNFLKEGQVDLLAGTSAGALITLMLARDAAPREVVLSGELESMFKSSLLYSNKLDPVQSITSLMGLTAWSGQKDTMKLFDHHFGNLTIGQLKHRVLIATFDYYGNQGFWKPKMFDNFSLTAMRELPVKKLAYYAASPATLRPVMDGYSDAGIFADNPALNALARVINVRCTEVRVSNSIWAILLCLKDRLTRAQEQLLQSEINFAQFTQIAGTCCEILEKELATLKAESGMAFDHPFTQELKNLNETYAQDSYSQQDLSSILSTQVNSELDFVEKLLTGDAGLSEKNAQQVQNKIATYRDLFQASFKPRGKKIILPQIVVAPLFEHKGDLYSLILGGPRNLGNIQLLSLGIGATVPRYFTKDFNLGILPFCLIPTNLKQAALFPPAFNLALDPVTEDTAYELANLLGKQHFHSLNPRVVGFPIPPVAVAVYTTRFDFWRRFYIQEIERRINLPEAKAAIEEALDWLSNGNWE